MGLNQLRARNIGKEVGATTGHIVAAGAIMNTVAWAAKEWGGVDIPADVQSNVTLVLAILWGRYIHRRKTQ